MTFPLKVKFHESSGYKHQSLTDGKVYTALAYTASNERQASTFLLVDDNNSFIEMPIYFFSFATKLDELLK